MLGFWIDFEHRPHRISRHTGCRFARNRGVKNDPKRFVLSNWRDGVTILWEGKAEDGAVFGRKCWVIEMLILRSLLHLNVDYLPFVLQDPVSILCVDLCPRDRDRSTFISSVGSLCPLASDCLQPMGAHRLQGGRRTGSWICFPGFLTGKFFSSSLLPDRMLLLLSWWSHLHNSLLPVSSNCPFPWSLWVYGCW